MKPLLKRSSQILLILLLLTAAWAAWTYPKIGALSYRLTMAIEARLYGLHPIQVEIGEMTLAVYEGGAADAETVILIHGYSAENEHWLRFARHLVDDYHVLIPDLAGHGDTGYQTRWDFGIAAQARRIKQMMDQLGVVDAHLVGNSMGGFIAAHFVWAYPEYSLTATLIDAAGVQSPQASDRDRMLARGEDPFSMHTREDFKRFYPMTMAQPPWAPAFVLDAQAEAYIARRDALEHIMRDLMNSEPLDAHLGEIQVPTLILWGREDRLIHFSTSQSWSALPASQITIWDGIGHMPHVEIPRISAERLRLFLEGSRRNPA